MHILIEVVLLFQWGNYQPQPGDVGGSGTHLCHEINLVCDVLCYSLYKGLYLGSSLTKSPVLQDEGGGWEFNMCILILFNPWVLSASEIYKPVLHFQHNYMTSWYYTTKGLGAMLELLVKIVLWIFLTLDNSLLKWPSVLHRTELVCVIYVNRYVASYVLTLCSTNLQTKLSRKSKQICVGLIICCKNASW